MIVLLSNQEPNWEVELIDQRELMLFMSETYDNLAKDRRVTRLDVPPLKVDTSFENEVNVLALTDIHVGQIFRSEDVNNFNLYNEEVIKRRITQILPALRKLRNKSELHIVTLGDLVHGDLPHHQDFSKTMEFGPVTQSIIASGIISAFIKETLKIFVKVKVHSIIGNHGRMPNKLNMPNIEIKENFDWLTMDLVRRDFQDIPNITFNNYASNYQIIDLYGSKIAITHGHGLSVGSNGVKSKLFTKFNELYSPDRTVDIMVHGHYHHNLLNEFPHGRFLVGIGSMVGADPYAFNNVLTASNPSQGILRFTKGTDRMTFNGVDIVWLD